MYAATRLPRTQWVSTRFQCSRLLIVMCFVENIRRVGAASSLFVAMNRICMYSRHKSLASFSRTVKVDYFLLYCLIGVLHASIATYSEFLGFVPFSQIGGCAVGAAMWLLSLMRRHPLAFFGGAVSLASSVPVTIFLASAIVDSAKITCICILACILSFVVTMIALPRCIAVLPGHCLHCGFPVDAATFKVCPECGRPARPAPDCGHRYIVSLTDRAHVLLVPLVVAFAVVATVVFAI